MKRILFILISIVFALAGYSQTALDASSLKGSVADYFDVADNKTYTYFYGSETADTISNNDTIWYRDYVVLNLLDELEHELRVKLDSVSGTPTVNVALQGKYSWNDSWTSISNADWAGTSSDTTIAINNTTAQNYRFLRVYLDANTTAQKSQVELIELGVYK